MESKRLILLALKSSRVPADARERIASIDGSREFFPCDDKKEIEARISEIEIAAGDFPPDLIAKAPNLRWLQLWSAGADWLQKHPESKKPDYILTTTSGIHARQMNEHLFGMILAWCRNFPRAFAAQTRREWYRPGSYGETAELSGKTMLVIGFGSIGEQTARIAAAFGLSVIGVRRNARPEEKRVDGVRTAALSDLPDLLPAADIVVNILPLTQDTRGMFDGNLFSRMKSSALYANIGRGGTTNEADLNEAVEKGTIAGAILDVTEEEPLSPSSPLWEKENVIITGHYAGFHPRYDAMAFDIFLDNLSRFVSGRPLANVVDKGLGY
jgi:phosphoglycerate dehydrogenase-like enzyme